MKLSLTIAVEAGENAPIVLRGSYKGSIIKASDIGYDAVEIHVNDPRTLDVESILQTCEEKGISVSTLGSGMGYTMEGLSFTDPDINIRNRAMARIEDHIAVARKLDAKVILGSMRGKIPNKNEYDKYQGYAVDCLKRVLEQAERYQVEITLEAINRYETNYINTVEQGLELIEKVGSRYLKLHLDTFHMNIEEVDIIESIKLAGNALGHVHFADSNRWYPGAGHLDYKAIITALKDINYSGAIAFECLPLPTQEEAAVKGLAHIKSMQ